MSSGRHDDSDPTAGVDAPEVRPERAIATDETVDLADTRARPSSSAPLLLPPNDSLEYVLALDEAEASIDGILESSVFDSNPDSVELSTPDTGSVGPFTQAMSPITPLIAGRYRTLSLVGRGSTGRVYRVFDVQLSEVVALKVMRADLVDMPEVVGRFRHEVRLARRVTHPNVARTFDIGEHAGLPFMTMEFIDGPSLRQYIDEQAPLAPPEVARIAAGLCAGLGAAHTAGIVHRDLKPDNIMLRANDDVVVTDFGIAQAFIGDHGSGRLFVGTPAYMAPEQVDGRAVADARADVYALGLILFEMLTGRRVWEGASPVVIATARLHRAPPEPGEELPWLPSPVVDLLRRCMSVDREVRPASVAEVSAVLQAHLGAEREPAESSPAVPDRLARVAVLPFATRDAGHAHLAEGLAEEVIDLLSMTAGLRVRPLAATLRHGASVDAQAAGRALDVGAVVSGRLSRRGDRLRMTARVTAVHDGFQLWAGRFECTLDRVPEVADDIAAAAAKALMVARAPAVGSVGASTGKRALDLFFKGRYQLRRHWHEDVRGAIELFDEARVLAPTDARILAAAAVARARMAFLGVGLADARMLDEASDLARQARSLAPERPEPYLAQAMVLFNQGWPMGAVDRLDMALARAPGDYALHDLIGRILLEVGPLERAVHHLDSAARLDPEAYNTRWDLARARAFEGDWAAVDHLLRLPVDDRQHAWVRTGIRARLDLWRPEPVWIDEPTPEGSGGLMEPVQRLLRSAARGPLGPADHEQLMAHAAAAAQSAPRRALLMHQFDAEFGGRAGDPARVLGALERAVRQGLTDRLWLSRCPLLVAVRGTRRFRVVRQAVERRLTQPSRTGPLPRL